MYIDSASSFEYDMLEKCLVSGEKHFARFEEIRKQKEEECPLRLKEISLKLL